jgi:hypothetical protein
LKGRQINANVRFMARHFKLKIVVFLFIPNYFYECSRQLGKKIFGLAKQICFYICFQGWISQGAVHQFAKKIETTQGHKKFFCIYFEYTGCFFLFWHVWHSNIFINFWPKFMFLDIFHIYIPFIFCKKNYRTFVSLLFILSHF